MDFIWEVYGGEMRDFYGNVLSFFCLYVSIYSQFTDGPTISLIHPDARPNLTTGLMSPLQTLIDISPL